MDVYRYEHPPKEARMYTGMYCMFLCSPRGRYSSKIRYNLRWFCVICNKGIPDHQAKESRNPPKPIHAVLTEFLQLRNAAVAFPWPRWMQIRVFRRFFSSIFIYISCISYWNNLEKKAFVLNFWHR